MAEGHRKRLKKRFINCGLEDFEEHNVLELLLFYSIPRKDTNPIAHRLIDRFGSLSGVLEAKPEQLVQVDGITENSAVLIKLIPELIKSYEASKLSSSKVFCTTEEIGEFFVGYYTDVITENVTVLLLGENSEILEKYKLCDGSVTRAGAKVKKLVAKVASKRVKAVAVAHNHPCGTVEASSDDLEFTNKLLEAFSTVNVKLIDNFIVADDKYHAIMHKMTAKSTR